MNRQPPPILSFSPELRTAPAAGTLIRAARFEPSAPVNPLMQNARISRPTAAVLCVSFLSLTLFPALYQFAAHPKEEIKRFDRFVSEMPTAESCKNFEIDLARESDLAKKVRPSYQRFATRLLGQGSHKVTIGADGFLFYRDSIEFAKGTGFLSPEFQRARRLACCPPDDAFGRFLLSFATGSFLEAPVCPTFTSDDVIEVFVDLRDQLRKRDIHFLVLPAPCKPSVYPEKLWPGYPRQAGPAVNADYAKWIQRLTDAGVEVLDTNELLWKAKERSNAPLFLEYDTHWAPEAVALTADELADRLRPMLGSYNCQTYEVETSTIGGAGGDLIEMLELGDESSMFPSVNHVFSRVLKDGQELHAGDETPVLLLGDSFTEIYDQDEPITGAGLAQQLMLRLGVGVQTVVVNQEAYAAGIGDPRVFVAKRPSVMDYKKVVIWEFASRILRAPDSPWDKVQMFARFPSRKRSQRSSH
jgi:hypothetical protein